MALASRLSDDFTIINDCDVDLTGGLAHNGLSALAVEPTILVEETDSWTARVNATGLGGISDDVADFTRTGLALYVWARSLDLIETKANGGWRLRIADPPETAADVNYGEWDISGSDTDRAQIGNFTLLVVDLDRAFDRTAGTGFAGTSVAAVAVVANHLTALGRATFFTDFWHVGTTIRCTGGDGASPAGTWADIAGFSAGDNNRALGVVQDIAGVFYVNGTVEIGDAAGTTASRYIDTNQLIFFPDNPVPGSGFNGIRISANATGTNEFRQGTKIGTGITAVGVAGVTFKAGGTPTFFFEAIDADIDASGVGLFGCNFIGGTATGGTVRFENANVEVLSCLFASMGTVSIRNGAILRGSSTITDSTATTGGALDLGDADPAADTVRDLRVQNSSRGILLRKTVAGDVTYNFRNIKFAGNTVADVRVDFPAGSTVTINILEGGDTPTIENVNGSTVNVVNSKVAKVTCIDSVDLLAIQSVRVLLEADTGGDLPVKESVTITRAGTVATVSHTAHGLTAGQKVTIRKADQVEYNGVFVIDSVTDANTYTYTVSGAPATPATGAITATGVLVEGLTNASGVVENTGWPFTNNQPVLGVARKSTASPRFKTAKIKGTLDTNGFTSTTVMTKDE